MKNCPICNGEVKDTAKFCKHCGNKIEQKELFCEECGAKLEAGSTFCDECGARLDGAPVQDDPWAHFNFSTDKSDNVWQKELSQPKVQNKPCSKTSTQNESSANAEELRKLGNKLIHESVSAFKGVSSEGVAYLKKAMIAGNDLAGCDYCMWAYMADRSVFKDSIKLLEKYLSKGVTYAYYGLSEVYRVEVSKMYADLDDAYSEKQEKEIEAQQEKYDKLYKEYKEKYKQTCGR